MRNSRFHPWNLRQRQTSRRGMTLVEMILVLTILGIMAGVSIPNLQRLWADQKIKEATEMVRMNLAGTRNKAIDAVLIYEFRYELGGNHFLVVPHEPDQMQSAAVDAQGQLASGDMLYRYAGTLRKGVQFAVATVDLSDLGIPVVEEIVPLADWQIQGLPMAEELTGLKWSYSAPPASTFARASPAILLSSRPRTRFASRSSAASTR